MVRSLAVVVAVVAVILLLNARDERATVRETDFAGPLAQARKMASYDVLGPVGLSDRWRATSVRHPSEDGGITWHVGFVTPRGAYAGLEQSAGPPGEFVDRFIDGSRADGEVRLGDRTWTRRKDGDPEPRGLVSRSDGSTTVVAGTAGWPELEELARSLRAE